ncbi:macro domain-containing protein [Glutamicibacter sp. 363]|uniref:macro domain-containing protein n=1 Tax=unclassified Glutamicibacter TaxID=2627139 RepID=UPI0020D121EF|nr:macro domain-containing protein [Glutamicibacter sp. BW80]
MNKILPRRVKVMGQRFLAALGVSAIPIGILAPLSPNWWEGKWWLVFFVGMAAAAWASLGLRRRPIQQTYPENVTIRLVVGDLFDQKASVVIGMTATFDTSVPDVIARNSLQGNFLYKVYDGSQHQLDQDLDQALASVDSVGTINKVGKQTVYPIGTVATLSPPGSIRYYCAAYTTMNMQNKATGTIRGMLDSLDECWNQADVHGNGAPICVPLIGQGQSRIPELTPEISVRLIAFSFLLRTKRSRFSRELRIVIHPDEQSKVNLPEFQAFLTSLVAA